MQRGHKKGETAGRRHCLHCICPDVGHWVFMFVYTCVYARIRVKGGAFECTKGV
jgi:hypothetical protein